MLSRSQHYKTTIFAKNDHYQIVISCWVLQRVWSWAAVGRGGSKIKRHKRETESTTEGCLETLESIILPINRENVGKLLIWRNVDIERWSSGGWEDET